MKLVTVLINLLRRPHKASTTLEDYKQAMLFAQGRAQFEKLIKKGLQVPIVLL